MGAAQKSTDLRVRRLPPADLGDGRDDPARQQAAANLPSGSGPRYLMATSIQRHLCPAAPETARYRLLPQRLAARPQAARAHGLDPERNPLSYPGPKSTRPAFHSGRKADPPTGGQGRSHDGKMLIVGAIELRDGNIARPFAAGRNLLLRHRRPRTLRRISPPIPSPSRKPTDSPATLHDFPPIASMSMSSGRPPLTSAIRCRGSTKSRSTTTQKDGRRGVYHGLRRKHLQAGSQ